MRTALIVGGAALLIYWCWPKDAAANPNAVDPSTTLTPSGQDATIYFPGGVAAGLARPSLDRTAAKIAARKVAFSPVTSKAALLKATAAINAQTPQSPAPGNPPDARLYPTVRGTVAVTQIT